MRFRPSALRRALNIDTVRQHVGEGELELPAIQAVESGIIRFIDTRSGLSGVWDAEFDRLPKSAGTTVGLTRIDHIAQSMDYSDMLSWSLFYTSLFNVQKKPVIDVIDPGGIVRSQVIESEDSGLRLTLNGAETDRTLAGRFVAGQSGSAVQHVAFETSDIFASARALRDLNFQSLPIPANYYDDVAARFGLSAAQRADLQALNILYDEDDGQRFYQLYSQPFGDGFFFEIVERQDGYGGYGAMNAPFRTAALRRHLTGAIAA